MMGQTVVNRMRGGKLYPVMATHVDFNESGFLSHKVTLELDPIAGRMITPVFGEIVSVFVPTQAMHAILDPEADHAGLTEVIRVALENEVDIFDLETEGEISQRSGVNPVSLAGVKKVDARVRLAYNCAINFLRQRKYVKATTLLHSNTAISEAIISMTVLERLKGVLDPEERVNGIVNFDTGTITANVHPGGNLLVNNIEFGDATTNSITRDHTGAASASHPIKNIQTTVASAVSTAAVSNRPSVTLPELDADLSGLNIGSVSLSDFYKAEMQDRIVRGLRKMVDANPQYGEEMVVRYVHGLAVETGKTPFVIAEQRRAFGRSIVPAMDADGVTDDIMRSDLVLELGFSVPIPRTELGGVVVTMACIKPDETISNQPHPFFTQKFGLRNYAADEMALDPVPVTIRELDSDCLAGQEATVALYTGNHALKRTYVSYGLGRNLNPETIENKTAIWQLEVPLSVTPDNILYPADLNHYPFNLSAPTDFIATVVSSSTNMMRTPLIFGPTPVEELAILDAEDVFDEEE